MESNKEIKCCDCGCENKESTTFTLPVSQETCDYLQRLGVSIDARLLVIDKIFSNHANDVNAAVLDSKPFQKYHSELEELNAEYTQAKLKFTEELKPIVYEKMGGVVDFTWNITDFLSKEVIITVK